MPAVNIVHPYMGLLVLQHNYKVAENAMLPLQCCLAVSVCACLYCCITYKLVENAMLPLQCCLAVSVCVLACIAA